MHHRPAHDVRAVCAAIARPGRSWHVSRRRRLARAFVGDQPQLTGWSAQAEPRHLHRQHRHEGRKRQDGAFPDQHKPRLLGHDEPRHQPDDRDGDTTPDHDRARPQEEIIGPGKGGDTSVARPDLADPEHISDHAHDHNGQECNIDPVHGAVGEEGIGCLVTMLGRHKPLISG